MEPRTQDDRLQRARKRVEELKGFYVHLGVYLLLNLGLFLVDVLDGGGWWFFWPLIGLGIVVAIHAVVLFGFEGALGRNWEERQIRRLMEEESGSGSA